MTLAWLPRGVAVHRFGDSPAGALLHPLGVLVFVAIQLDGFARHLLGRPVGWKGRCYPRRSGAPPEGKVAAAELTGPPASGPGRAPPRRRRRR